MGIDMTQPAPLGADENLGRAPRPRASRSNRLISGDGRENTSATRQELYERLSLNALWLVARIRQLAVPDGAQRHEIIRGLQTYDEQAAKPAKRTPRTTATRRLQNA